MGQLRTDVEQHTPGARMSIADRKAKLFLDLEIDDKHVVLDMGAALVGGILALDRETPLHPRARHRFGHADSAAGSIRTKAG
mgnify:CR=1 FL=1